ncbi:MAG: AI-2E family transporter [Flavobacterium sp.]
MPISTQKQPFLAKFTYSLIIIIGLGFLFFIGQNIISPLLIALLFAILLRPVVSFLNVKLHIPNVIASLFTVLLFSLLFVGIFYFISTQIAIMADDWGKIKSNLAIHYDNIQSYISETFNFSRREQNKIVKDAASGSQDTGKQIIGITLLSFTDALLSIILVPLYMFLILLYRTHFKIFLCKLFDEKHHVKLRDILNTIKISVQSYLLGLLFELLIVSGLTALGLWIIGVKYAILLGIITGLLNLIPYIGILIAGLLSIIASLTGTADLSIIIGIIIVNVVVQLIDNNLLVPLVVSSKVEINSIATIVGIIIAGAVAGISGMFLAIPLMAILKVIFDRVEPLEAWGYLLGDDLPKSFNWKKSKTVAAVPKTPKTE